MKVFDEWKSAKKSKALVLKKIDSEIKSASSAEDVSRLMDMRRKAKLNGVEAGEVLKVIANVAVVVAIVGFEMFTVLNAKASRFIKTL
jgi:hypothetical protein